jgi:hypothetical protein
MENLFYKIESFISTTDLNNFFNEKRKTSYIKAREKCFFNNNDFLTFVVVKTKTTIRARSSFLMKFSKNKLLNVSEI